MQLVYYKLNNKLLQIWLLNTLDAQIMNMYIMVQYITGSYIVCNVFCLYYMCTYKLPVFIFKYH